MFGKTAIRPRPGGIAAAPERTGADVRRFFRNNRRGVPRERKNRRKKGAQKGVAEGIIRSWLVSAVRLKAEMSESIAFRGCNLHCRRVYLFASSNVDRPKVLIVVLFKNVNSVFPPIYTDVTARCDIRYKKRALSLAARRAAEKKKKPPRCLTRIAFFARLNFYLETNIIVPACRKVYSNGGGCRRRTNKTGILKEQKKTKLFRDFWETFLSEEITVLESANESKGLVEGRLRVHASFPISSLRTRHHHEGM